MAVVMNALSFMVLFPSGYTVHLSRIRFCYVWTKRSLLPVHCQSGVPKIQSCPKYRQRQRRTDHPGGGAVVFCRGGRGGAPQRPAPTGFVAQEPARIGAAQIKKQAERRCIWRTTKPDWSIQWI
ncbi:hypothetical protein [Hoeflea olei]|uniref:hypothetical protein n=1 Tax=Hoeflea olei TaxID=1480615 RepID=UPI00111222B5|nr:hypothetical protein [Hoeflea olei]